MQAALLQAAICCLVVLFFGDQTAQAAFGSAKSPLRKRLLVNDVLDIAVRKTFPLWRTQLAGCTATLPSMRGGETQLLDAAVTVIGAPAVPDEFKRRVSYHTLPHAKRMVSPGANPDLFNLANVRHGPAPAAPAVAAVPEKPSSPD